MVPEKLNSPDLKSLCCDTYFFLSRYINLSTHQSVSGSSCGQLVFKGSVQFGFLTHLGKTGPQLPYWFERAVAFSTADPSSLVIVQVLI
jgi:hypothetical protein